MARVACVVALVGVLSPCAGAMAQPEACAAKLSPHAREIYDQVEGGMHAGTLRDQITKETKQLVMDGRLRRDDARPAAEEAAACLRSQS